MLCVCKEEGPFRSDFEGDNKLLIEKTLFSSYIIIGTFCRSDGKRFFIDFLLGLKEYVILSD